jgi:hypothetical protein
MPGRSAGGAAQIDIREVYSAWQGNAEAMATLIRRTLRRTWAPIFSSLGRMVSRVALANWGVAQTDAAERREQHRAVRLDDLEATRVSASAPDHA